MKSKLIEYYFTATAEGIVIAPDTQIARDKVENRVIEMIRTGVIKIKLEVIPE